MEAFAHKVVHDREFPRLMADKGLLGWLVGVVEADPRSQGNDEWLS